LTCIALLWLPGVTAAEWVAGPADGELSYTAFYEGSPIPGRFREYRVAVSDGEDGTPTGIDVTVDIGSVTMGAGDLDEAIRAPEWFDTARFPQASFTAISVRPDGNDRFWARGLFTLKGTPREIELPFIWQRISPEMIDMQGRVELKRLDFGIGTGEWSTGDQIGLDVVVEFHLTLRHQS